MNLLIIEDQADFVEKVERACVNAGTTNLLSPDTVSLKNLTFSEEEPVEDQLAKLLRSLIDKYSINLVMLDTDLSRAQKELRTQTEYRQAFQSLGVPVCRYKKGQSTTKLAALEDLRKLALDGASAVWIPKHLLDGDLAQLIAWIEKVAAGFHMLFEHLKKQPEVLNSPLGPSGILANILGREDLKSDFLGYTAQNSFFFTTNSESNEADFSRLYSTQIGYWLLNYILAFPGPILNPIAAAAYLNLMPVSFEQTEVQALLEGSRYDGPFRELGFFWKEDLSQLLNGWDGDIAKAPELASIALTRVDPDNPQAMAYFCVLDQKAIKENETAINPDWIPPGAQLSRIRESELDELGPMLKI